MKLIQNDCFAAVLFQFHFNVSTALLCSIPLRSG